MNRVASFAVAAIFAGCGGSDDGGGGQRTFAPLRCLENRGGTVVRPEYNFENGVYDNNPALLAVNVQFPAGVVASPYPWPWSVELIVARTLRAAKRLTKNACYRPGRPDRCTTDDHARMRWRKTIVRWTVSTYWPAPPEYLALIRDCFRRPPDAVWSPYD